MRLLININDVLKTRFYRKVFIRLKSNKAGKEKNKRYSDTLNLPRTAFPLSMKQANISKRELNILEVYRTFENITLT